METSFNDNKINGRAIIGGQRGMRFGGRSGTVRSHDLQPNSELDRPFGRNGSTFANNASNGLVDNANIDNAQNVDFGNKDRNLDFGVNNDSNKPGGDQTCSFRKANGVNDANIRAQNPASGRDGFGATEQSRVFYGGSGAFNSQSRPAFSGGRGGAFANNERESVRGGGFGTDDRGRAFGRGRDENNEDQSRSFGGGRGGGFGNSGEQSRSFNNGFKGRNRDNGEGNDRQPFGGGRGGGVFGNNSEQNRPFGGGRCGGAFGNGSEQSRPFGGGRGGFKSRDRHNDNNNEGDDQNRGGAFRRSEDRPFGGGGGRGGSTEPDRPFGGGGRGRSAFGNGDQNRSGRGGRGRGGFDFGDGRGFGSHRRNSDHDNNNKDFSQRGGSSARGFGNSSRGFGAAPFGARRNAFSSNRWGESVDSNDRAAPDDSDRTRGYIPPVRPIEDLFEEDERNAENYRIVVDDDEDINVDNREITTSGRGMAHIRAIDTWDDANLEPKLLENVVENSKYVRPRKIQAHSIPFILEGSDVKAHAETGSGKTAAFMVPIINVLMKLERKRGPLSGPTPYALIVEPTRELCDQVWGQARKWANGTGLVVARAYGQFDRHANLKELMRGCDILCATPGRLWDFVGEKLVSVKNVRFLVLDEADRLLECSFMQQLRDVITSPDFPNRENRQTLLFSATFPPEIQLLCDDILKPHNNVFLSIKKKFDANEIVIDDDEMANGKIIQNFFLVKQDDKKDLLLEILRGKNDLSIPVDVSRTLVFVQRKSDADLLAIYLSQQGIMATTINANRSQAQRELALAAFRRSEMKVLVSTDVCARGIDIKEMDHVINFDMPTNHITYIHRIGRTGRLKGGFATSFFDEFNENDCALAPALISIIRKAGQNPPEFLKKLSVSKDFSMANDPIALNRRSSTCGFVTSTFDEPATLSTKAAGGSPMNLMDTIIATDNKDPIDSTAGPSNTRIPVPSQTTL